MKLHFFLALVGTCAASAIAQPYSIDWFKIAGGGGTSTGGNYSLSGTIGQHDAGGAGWWPVGANLQRRKRILFHRDERAGGQ